MEKLNYYTNEFCKVCNLSYDDLCFIFVTFMKDEPCTFDTFCHVLWNILYTYGGLTGSRLDFWTRCVLSYVINDIAFRVRVERR